jgi:uncharacterized phage protein (TIGR02218 family)
VKNIPTPLLQHVRGTLTTLSTCWKITRTDGIIQAFTDAAKDLTIAGLRYLALTGYEPTAIESAGDLSVDNLEVSGLLNSGAFTASDIAAGIYDSAEVVVFYVNRRALADGVIPLKRGTLGQASWEQGKFKIEVRGSLQPFQQNIIGLFTKSCTATLGDERCRVDLTNRYVTGAIGELVENRGFRDPGRTEPDGTFAYGVVTFTAGACAGLSIEVRAYTVGYVELLIPMPRPLAVGDTYALLTGCDHSRETCRDKFDNVLNFRGFPDVPDQATIMSPA